MSIESGIAVCIKGDNGSRLLFLTKGKKYKLKSYSEIYSTYLIENDYNQLIWASRDHVIPLDEWREDKLNQLL